MIVLDMLAWWYTTAWFEVLHKVQHRTVNMLELFSVGLLVRTLFAPFRQIDAGRVRGPIDVQLRAWFDRTFSRFFGAMVRTAMIICGSVAAIGVFIGGVVWAAVWLLVPILPIVGLIIMVV